MVISCGCTTTQTDFKLVTNHFILFILQVVYIEGVYFQLTLQCELNRFTLIHFSHVSKIQHGEYWTETETKPLLSIWGSKQTQNDLDSVVRNRNIYERISNQLNKSGVSRNWKQCRDRVKNLLVKYRKVKDNRQTRNHRQNCSFYSKIDAIVGTRPFLCR